MLRAGYMEDWKYNKTYSGTPQGGVISPILANIYLNKLDDHVERLCDQNSFGKERKYNPEVMRLNSRISRQKKKIQGIDPDSFNYKENWEETRRRELLRFKLLQWIAMEERPMDDFDKSFRRLKYCRYADDFVLGYIGSKEEAEGIMANIKSFLEKELLLEVSEEKTKIESHKTGIRFLGYDIHSSSAGEYFKKTIVKGAPSYKRYGTFKIYLYAPWDKLKEFCKSRSYGDWTNPEKSKHRAYLINLSDAEILSKYNSEIRGMYQYYKLAHDYSRAFWRFHYLADYSCRKTLASKHKSTVKKISKTYVKRGPKGDKRLTVFVERNGRTYQLAKPNDIDRKYRHWEKNSDEYDYDTITEYFIGRNDLTKRRKMEICESCGVKTAFVEEHHIRALKDIRKSAKWWEKQMIARSRKTLILCISCHDQLHAGTLPDMRAIKKKKQEYLIGAEQ
jgi:RNA-directed DNA polymerase